jgi:hypothetical protein
MFPFPSPILTSESDTYKHANWLLSQQGDVSRWDEKVDPRSRMALS